MIVNVNRVLPAQPSVTRSMCGKIAIEAHRGSPVYFTFVALVYIANQYAKPAEHVKHVTLRALQALHIFHLSPLSTRSIASLRPLPPRYVLYFQSVLYGIIKSTSA